MSRTFNANIDQGETYAELLEYAAQGYNVPPSRLINAKRRDEAASEAASEADQIRTALQNAAAERAKRRAALDAEYLPILADKIEELAELDQAADAARVAAREAIAAYRSAARKSQSKFYEIRDTVRDTYGDPAVDDDGNPTDHTHVRMGVVTVNGETVKHHGMPEVMHSPAINRL